MANSEPASQLETTDRHDPNVCQEFVVYLRSDFDQAATLGVYTIAQRGAAQQPDAMLTKDYDQHANLLGRATPHFKAINGDGAVRSIQMNGWRTMGGDQNITVTFSDGAKVWYKQPRWGRVVRDRWDTWIRGRRWSGHELKDAPISAYPSQLLITRPRRADDPTNDVSYNLRFKGARAVGVAGGVLGGAFLGWLALAGLPLLAGVYGAGVSVATFETLWPLHQVVAALTGAALGGTKTGLNPSALGGR